jgi:type IV pilus assembly protein PilC
MLFRYRAKNQDGQTVKGEIEAVTEASAIEALTEQGLVILSLVEIEKRGGFSFFKNIFIKVKAQDILLFSRQLAVMVSAGLSIVRALEALAEQTTNRELRRVCLEISSGIRGGARLSSVLAKYPHLFDSFYLNMVRAGETSGKLDEVLNYLADELEKNYDLKSKIKGAMIYPVFVLVAVFLIGILMMTFVLPKILQVLTESGAPLPLVTKILLTASNFLHSYWYLILAILVVVILLLRIFINTEAGRLIFDRFKLNVPVFGPLFKRIYLVRFARSFSTLIIGGVPVASALRIVSDVVGNVFYKDLILQTVKAVEDGQPVAAGFSKTKEIPAMVTHMLAIGEQTGRLDSVLDKLANFYAREIENILGRLTVLIEPLIIIILGIGVAIIVAAVMLPMYNLAAGVY